MKFTSVTIVALAACGGNARSSLRAAYSPPKPPPRITTFQAIGGDYAQHCRQCTSATGLPSISLVTQSTRGRPLTCSV
jgi:hypothetical protein